ncbi:CBS domain containing protein [Methylocella tundrae]|uniref:CBS domain containing protein n=1 Tax=Methylocella tundrae TaxID=227605 RepID=A0A8B6LZZ7_METTU|nr:hemolysin family protein [Methylocella tundrae]VTZ22201.1 CBS domain containing protein [Methylocella tundrae]VTZ48351.1 CBS domain containing protein [Methylocella tundrae]
MTTMSERESPAAGEAGTERAPAKPNLFDRLRAIFGLGGASIRDDIQDALADSSIEVDVSPQERTMLRNVLALHEVQVEDVMVPRADIVAVSLDSSLIEVLAVFRTAGHSRLPVHGETLDDPRGMIHIRDLVAYFAAGIPEPVEDEGDRPTPPSVSETDAADSFKLKTFADFDIPLAEANVLRPVLFVPPSMPALDLLVKMQATRTHMALVIDEYGGTDGLATIEDIVEMIVGDIEDEHDLDESPKIDAAPDGSFIVDARASLEDVSLAIDADLTAISDAEEVDTIGGLITTLAGHVPVRGEIIVEGGLEFEILDADPRRVKRVRIHLGLKRAAAKSLEPQGGSTAGDSSPAAP